MNNPNETQETKHLGKTEEVAQRWEKITKIFEAAIYFLYTLPSEVRIEDIASVSAISVVLCFCATIYPSYKAAKLNPVDALRYE